MKFSEEQRKEFEAAVRPLIKFMNENCRPHTTTVVDCTRAELSEGVCAFVTEDYIKDWAYNKGYTPDLSYNTT